MAGSDRYLVNTAVGLLAAATAGSLVAPALAQPTPPHSRPGQCFAKMAYPARYRTVVERVAGAPVIRYRDVPAVVEHSSRQVLVVPARVDHEHVDAVYKTTWRWVETPGPMRQVSTSPVYRTVTERHLISPAHLAWRAGGVAHGFSNGSGYGQTQVRPTGEVLCRVLIPARYGWSRRRVLVSPGCQTTVQGPPHRQRIQDRVLVSPEHTVDHPIAAVYRTENTSHVTQPARRDRVVSPGPVHTVAHRVMVSPTRFGWNQIVCIPRGHGSRQAPAAVQPPPMPSGPSYGAPAPSLVQSYGGGGSYGGAPAYAPAPSHQYRPDEVLAPTPHFSSSSRPGLVPAPYDVGHPARS